MMMSVELSVKSVAGESKYLERTYPRAALSTIIAT
jgi:hypothetical protein